MKRPNECIACSSRRCFARISSTSSREGGPEYDEIACLRHVREMETDADRRAQGLRKHHHSSTSTLQRAPKTITWQERRLIEVGEGARRIGAGYTDCHAECRLSFEFVDGRWIARVDGRSLAEAAHFEDLVLILARDAG